MIELVTKDWTQTELIELAGRFGYWFEPGEDWSYSSTNYFLLGVVVERASGLSLAEAYRRYVYQPLGLESTWQTWHEPAAGRLSITGYMGPVQEWSHSEMFGDLGPTALLDRSPVEWGAGGLAATALDATAFLAGLMRGNLLQERTRARMLEFHATPPLGGVTVAVFFNRGFVGQRKALDSVVTGIASLGGPLAACSDTRRTPSREGPPSSLPPANPGAPDHRQRP